MPPAPRSSVIAAWLLVACSSPPSRQAPADAPAQGTTVEPKYASTPEESDGGAPTVVTPDAAEPAASERIVPLYGPNTMLEPELLFDRGDAIVTRYADRARDRHAREDQFQSYDHYLPHYWEHRTARFQLVDTVAKGGSTIDVSFVTEWKLGPAEFRAWYYGMGSVAHYSGNYAPLFAVDGPGTYDNDHVKVSAEGTQYRYTYTIRSAIELDGSRAPLAVGQFMEIECSQFLDAPPVGRANYYGTVFLYEVGKGGVVPWYAVGNFDDKSSERENSHKLDEAAWLGGRTTLPYPYSDEPDNHYMQMATNMSGVNAQAFVNGRRVHHTNMIDGSHDESAENETYKELVGLAGPYYVNHSCDACHTRNGRAKVAAVGEPLTSWVFKVGSADGSPDPRIGRVLQPRSSAGGVGEGSVSIARWVEKDGLRTPEYAFDGVQPARFSARLAPPLIGMGLLEAIAEDTVLAQEDVDDRDGDGISGKAQLVKDPVTGEPRLGRLGWKAGASSVRHQSASALNTDMGVTTTLLPRPDCGTEQTGCGNEGPPELSDQVLAQLVKYVSLLGVRARRDLHDAEALRGEVLLERAQCTACHTPTVTTSPYHPLAELRAQTIHPYTDLLLHDMGAGLADSLGEAEASGAEWRTTPLWGIGLSACVTGGVEGPFQKQVCKPSASYLHDGRARTIEEAILWHGGEAEAAQAAYRALSQDDKAALLRFLASL